MSDSEVEFIAEGYQHNSQHVIISPPGADEVQLQIKPGELFYAPPGETSGCWMRCCLRQILSNPQRLEVTFLNGTLTKTVSTRHLAYYDRPRVPVPEGARVLGKCEKLPFYPGIIAETIKKHNNRYLIFYDDGHCQYVKREHIRLVCQASENVWEDVDARSRGFIQMFLTQNANNRLNVRVQKGEVMAAWHNEEWIEARVIDIDCSLIQLQFEDAPSHTEWIYRGSFRLRPIYRAYGKTVPTHTIPIPRVTSRTVPFLLHTTDAEAAAQAQEPEANSADPAPSESGPEGKVVHYIATGDLLPRPRRYIMHSCNPSCLFPMPHNLRAYGPLLKPLLSGWERYETRKGTKSTVCYRGPCGKILPDMEEVHRYLRLTENILNVDNFDFDLSINCLAEYVAERVITEIADISGQIEQIAVPAVNTYDHTLPTAFQYFTGRKLVEGVKSCILDKDALVCCDCEDDCSDKSKCSCWQLTFAGAKYGNPNMPVQGIGYQYKRLFNQVPTGIYECNSRCKCKSSCLNRVVQEPLQLKLQIFKTANRGWGLRCLNDVPKGSFICKYAGLVLCHDIAEKKGKDAGDEYFTDLDFIELAEKAKAGYESQPEEPEEDDVLDDVPSTSNKRPRSRTPAKKRKAIPKKIATNVTGTRNSGKHAEESSTRKLFGEDEFCYVVDAKTHGNVGRFINHSCSPNLITQSVFVDTHDLRAPWVGIFAMSTIPAGTELTWYYGYEIGSVPYKILYCECGELNCRRRLL